LAIVQQTLTIARVLFEVEIAPVVDRIVEAVWAIVVVFLATNNSTTPEKF